MVTIANLHIADNYFIDLIGSFLFLVVAILYYYQTKRKNRNTPMLTYGFLVAFVSQFSNSLLGIAIDPVNKLIHPSLEVFIVNIILVSGINAILFFFWIFLERTESVRVNRFMSTLVTVLLSIYFVTIFLGIIVNKINETLYIANFILPVTITLVVARSIYILYKTYVVTNYEYTALFQLFSFILILLWAVIALFVTGSTILINFYGMNLSTPQLGIIPDVLYYTGLTIFILTILANPNYIYRIPMNIRDIVILSKIGVAVYGIGMTAEEKSLDEQMLAGFLSAANSFVQEMQPNFENEELKIIESTHRKIQLLYGRRIGISLVSLQENWYLRNSIQSFLNYLETVQDPSDLLDSGQFYDDDEIRVWLKLFFPYLDIDKMQTY